MDIERAVISKIIFTGQIEKAFSRKLKTEHFADDECRDMYKYILDYVHRYKSAPSLEAARHDKPDFEWIQMQDTLDYLLDRFTVKIKHRLASDMVLELGRACDDSERVENIDLEFLEASRHLVTVAPSVTTDRFSDVEKRVRLYEQRKAEGKPISIPYGYTTLDRLTGGIMSHELVTVLGFTNVGKSTLLRSLAFNIWAQEYTPLYISLEMEAHAILNIFDAMAANLDYKKLKQLQLEEHDMENWRALAERIKDNTHDIPVIDSLYRMTPDQAFAEMLRHKPDVVIIDYVGLMKSNSTSRGVNKYQQMVEITQDLKINCRMLKIPIIMAAQTNRAGSKDGAELDNVGDSISISQDSDTVLGLFQSEDMERQKEMEIRLSKSRLGPRGKLTAVWDHDRQVFREKTFSDVLSSNGAAP